MRRDLIIPDEFADSVRDLVSHPLVQSMDQYIHHSQVTCLEHCLSVSWHSYRASRRLGLDCRAAARSGLLHDFYLYDSHLSHPIPGLHGFTHPGTALKNARAHFVLDPVEAASIETHMWPLTWRPPRHRVAWLVCLTDKYCALAEVLRFSSWRHLRILKTIPGE